MKRDRDDLKMCPMMQMMSKKGSMCCPMMMDDMHYDGHDMYHDDPGMMCPMMHGQGQGMMCPMMHHGQGMMGMMCCPMMMPACPMMQMPMSGKKSKMCRAMSADEMDDMKMRTVDASDIED